MTHLARQAAARRSTRVLRAHRLSGTDQANSVPWQHPEAGYLDADVAWARRAGTCTSHTEIPQARDWVTDPKNPTEKRAGPTLREFGSRILHFLTGSARVILSLPPSLPAHDPVMTAVLSPTSG